ncbi:MAG: twin-arginine translocase subunit TatC [Sphingobacteriaceae bacterium]|nr:twin-arginine translocase subunit TatC [Sphingobacteriaceae bacterium]
MGFFGSNKEANEAGEMSFLQHLEALRWHLVRSAVVIMAFAIAIFCLPQLFIDTILLGPIEQDFISYRALCALGYKIGAGSVMCMHVKQVSLQTLGISEQFFTHMGFAFMGGIILGFPYVLWELWKFIRPALKDKELGPVKIFVVIASFLFLVGICFGYFIMFPMSYNFLINYQMSDKIITNQTLSDYTSFIYTLTLVSGIIFEMPVLVYFLTRLTLITPQFMRKYRKHAVVVLLIVSAVVTPSPDVTSQMVVAVPMYLLYELSVFISAWTIKKYKLND